MPVPFGMTRFSNLREYNHYHDEAGRFTTASGNRTGSAPPVTGGRGTSPVHGTGGTFSKTPGTAPPYERPKPVQVKTAAEAIPLILKGQVVELPDPKQANTLLRKLAAMAKDAEARGEDAPNYDLCNVTVASAQNLFCTEKVRTKEHPNGIPRIQMPQFSGYPEPGSAADKLPKDKKGRVDATAAFIDHLKSLGIKTIKSRVPAARLKASQAELVGPKVAGMMTSGDYDPAKEPIFISRDHYVVDGHHRWAAVVGRDSADGRLGDLRMQTIKIDAPITEVLKIAGLFAKSIGIKPEAGPKAKKPVQKARRRA